MNHIEHVRGWGVSKGRALEDGRTIVDIYYRVGEAGPDGVLLKLDDGTEVTHDMSDAIALQVEHQTFLAAVADDVLDLGIALSGASAEQLQVAAASHMTAVAMVSERGPMPDGQGPPPMWPFPVEMWMAFPEARQHLVRAVAYLALAGEAGVGTPPAQGPAARLLLPPSGLILPNGG